MTITIPDSTQHAPPGDGFSQRPYAGFLSRTSGEQEPTVSATGAITTVVAANILDEETFTLDDGVRSVVFEFEATAIASGSITTVAVASLVDAETFTLDDGVHPATVFEFDKASDGVTSGRVNVDVSTDVSADDVRDRIISAINTVGTSLEIGRASCRERV